MLGKSSKKNQVNSTVSTIVENIKKESQKKTDKPSVVEEKLSATSRNSFFKSNDTQSAIKDEVKKAIYKDNAESCEVFFAFVRELYHSIVHRNGSSNSEGKSNSSAVWVFASKTRMLLKYVYCYLYNDYSNEMLAKLDAGSSEEFQTFLWCLRYAYDTALANEAPEKHDAEVTELHKKIFERFPDFKKKCDEKAKAAASCCLIL